MKWYNLYSRFGESSVSVSTSSTSTALGSEAGANVLPVENSTCMPSAEAGSERELSSSGGLRSPPGLPHPSTSTSDQPQVQPQAQLESTSTLASDVSVTQQTSSDGQLRLDDVASSSGVLKSMSIDLPMELPSNTSQTATIEVSAPSLHASQLGQTLNIDVMVMFLINAHVHVGNIPAAFLLYLSH